MIQQVYSSTKHRICAYVSMYANLRDDDNLIGVIQVQAPHGKSDHTVLSWDLQLASQEMPSVQTKYNYYKGDFVVIQTGLQLINWNERWKDKSVNEMWCDLVQLLKEQVALHVPLKK